MVDWPGISFPCLITNPPSHPLSTTLSLCPILRFWVFKLYLYYTYCSPRFHAPNWAKHRFQTEKFPTDVLFSLGYFWSRAPKSLLKYMAPIWRPISVVIPWLSRSSAPQISPDPKWLLGVSPQTSWDTPWFWGIHKPWPRTNCRCAASLPGPWHLHKAELNYCLCGKWWGINLGDEIQIRPFQPHSQTTSPRLCTGDVTRWSQVGEHGARTKNNETAMDCHGES
jgi:hypothetical protein